MAITTPAIPSQTTLQQRTQMRAIATQLNLSMATLEMLRDVDRLEDLPTFPLLTSA
ncbi:MAG: hypothetical protein O2890_15740 [Cyanobacteria bacterium]|nr:hypothetical protein [Cyanobacteriota bacterium]MDA0867820.1 hypothetical protein [Cyanobacteriota bacterium]